MVGHEKDKLKIWCFELSFLASVDLVSWARLQTLVYTFALQQKTIGRTEGGEKDCSAMVRVRKVVGLDHLALVAYRELVVDMAGKIEEAVRGKQMGLGMEQEVVGWGMEGF